MGTRDWFRKTTWTEEDQTDFWKRYSRARTASTKSQYLRIQAFYLQTNCPRAALELLDSLIEEFPESFQLAQAEQQRGQILLSEYESESGLMALRMACRHEKSHPHVRTQAWSDFGLAVVKHQRTDLYEEAVEFVEVNISQLLFPKQRYHAHAIIAMIHHQCGESKDAASHAREALKAAEMDFPGFPRHPDMG